MKQSYYYLKPLIPRRMQIYLRRKLITRQLDISTKVWPIDKSAAKVPDNWEGWPGNKQFAFVLTHDVELAGGHNKCRHLMELEMELGFRSSFNFVPERYTVSPLLRTELVKNGFEVGVHGLKHDGKLYSSRKEFLRRAVKINNYLAEWNAVGFRSPSMHHNLEWIHDLNILYDSSTFDTDPFEPQSDGVRTIYPFWVNKKGTNKGYLEMPYTLPQDFSLFILMREETIDIWKKKLDWIADRGGMALLNVHPDYINFKSEESGDEEFPVKLYREFLEYVKEKYEGKYWHVLPKELALYSSEQMKQKEASVVHEDFKTDKRSLIVGK